MHHIWIILMMLAIKLIAGAPLSIFDLAPVPVAAHVAMAILPPEKALEGTRQTIAETKAAMHAAPYTSKLPPLPPITMAADPPPEKHKIRVWGVDESTGLRIASADPALQRIRVH